VDGHAAMLQKIEDARARQLAVGLEVRIDFSGRGAVLDENKQLIAAGHGTIVRLLDDLFVALRKQRVEQPPLLPPLRGRRFQAPSRAAPEKNTSLPANFSGVMSLAGTWKVRAANKEFTMLRNSYAAINAIFECDLAHSGGVVRRSVKFIEDNGLSGDLAREVKERSCHLLIIGDSYFIVCNEDLNIKVIV
jgi:hypothetical protein